MLGSLSALAVAAMLNGSPMHAERPPNFVIVFCDDLGYGDLACYGHPTIRTPHLDAMAEAGQKWTSFYSAAPVCTPSRASLMTGRLPIRNGMTSNTRRVLFPNSAGGLPAAEITLAEALSELGYATGHFGKWHLGHLPEHLPTRHGFDTWYGIPYSNDMMWAGKDVKRRDAFAEPKSAYWNVPLMRDEQTIEQPANQETITRRYTEEAVTFIRDHADEPFFVYLAHSMPHVPLFRSEEFAGRSLRGMYGDVIEEIDHSVGTVLQALREEGLEKNTVVVFTSDNGPWLPYKDHGGSAGLLRGGKGSTWEGGMRVPGIFWGPGLVEPGVVRLQGSTLDLLPTFVEWGGGVVPQDRPIDGVNLGEVLRKGESEVDAPPREVMFFYRDEDLFAVRMGRHKAHFQTREGYGQPKVEAHQTPLLFDLDVDPGEQYDLAAAHPELIEAIRELVAAHQGGLSPVENQLLPRVPTASEK
ncbi:MAG: sulfatase [Phycisphaerales bacterium]|nr:sulfatase [Phycisphaerales bacterium]